MAQRPGRQPQTQRRGRILALEGGLVIGISCRPYCHDFVGALLDKLWDDVYQVSVATCAPLPGRLGFH